MDKQKAIETIKEFVKPGDTLYTVLRQVSRSGMYRHIAVFAISEGRPVDISGMVAKAIGATYKTKTGAVGVAGCGMDMGFDVVYNLSYALNAGGFGCIGEKCLSNDHSNGDRDYTPHHGKVYTAETCPGKPCGKDCDHKERDGKEHWHKNGGYALKQAWL